MSSQENVIIPPGLRQSQQNAHYLTQTYFLQASITAIGHCINRQITNHFSSLQIKKPILEPQRVVECQRSKNQWHPQKTGFSNYSLGVLVAPQKKIGNRKKLRLSDYCKTINKIHRFTSKVGCLILSTELWGKIFITSYSWALGQNFFVGLFQFSSVRFVTQCSDKAQA